MARVRKKGDKTLSYSIEPHPKGLGLVVIERIGKTKKKTKQAGSAILLARIYAKQQ
ncbi:hypothetical protein [Pasteurella multocida]|uniref:hypothetical protein n=1 Tax=Pasteurella multocida TaxID=747 RepID=UPI002260FD79|nr:hypothetical protein [Pasteurella multocida]UZV60269.1 hypothetical protein OR608_00320 [Pasteurella multocida]